MDVFVRLAGWAMIVKLRVLLECMVLPVLSPVTAITVDTAEHTTEAATARRGIKAGDVSMVSKMGGFFIAVKLGEKLRLDSRQTQNHTPLPNGFM